jgi:hypothetical protein
MPRPLVLCLGLFLLVTSNAYSQQTASSKTLNAFSTNGSDIRIDGLLSDSVWDSATFTSDFLQRDPVQGAPSTHLTEVAFLFDGDALYIGARMQSSDVRALVARRDARTNSERLAISLDTYLNGRTASTFVVTAAGVRLDYFHNEDVQSKTDYSFDPVWSAAANVTANGWTAEMRIPFSQLRFNESPEQVWGLNINRGIPAENEDIYWVVIPKNEAGWASRFGRLTGISNITPSRRMEILPYVATSATQKGEVDSQNPFTSKTSSTVRIGGDLKVGLGPNFTLDATINPDFGQVEADPAEVNLTAFETFFSEKRPFFNEGGDLFSESLFYSRRIGAQPRGQVAGDYVDQPDNTTILGAAKVTGRTLRGLSISAVGAVTQTEHARVYNLASGSTTTAKVEPFAGYMALAGQQEMGENGSTLGFTGTAVRRDVNDSENVSDDVNSGAYTGELNFNLRSEGGAYALQGEFGASHLTGSAERISRLQKSSVHYFQRPDASHVSNDPSKTSLTGTRGSISFNKNNGRLLGSTFVRYVSTMFDPNDFGRLQAADDVAWMTRVNYRQTERGSLFHSYNITLSHNRSWNMAGKPNMFGLDLDADLTWLNYWFTSIEFGYNPTEMSDTATRGGPRMAIGGEQNVVLEVRSDASKRFSYRVRAFYEEDELERRDAYVTTGVSWQPSQRLEISLSPSWRKFSGNRQYIQSMGGGSAATFGRRYIFSLIDRSDVSARIRVNYTVNPRLSLEVYVEPFAASGNYYRYGELVKPESLDLLEYGEGGTTKTDLVDGNVEIAAGGDPFILSNRDFNVTSFRSNMVFRWEWRPGSTLFLVWQQDRNTNNNEDHFVRPGNLFDSISDTGDNFFSLKLSYWIPAN